MSRWIALALFVALPAFAAPPYPRELLDSINGLCGEFGQRLEVVLEPLAEVRLHNGVKEVVDPPGLGAAGNGEGIGAFQVERRGNDLWVKRVR